MKIQFLLFVGLVPALFAQENNLESVLNEVVGQLARRDFPAALALFDTITPEDAEKTEILIMRASIFNSAGRPAEARKIANGIIAVEPDNTDALMILADAAAREGKDRERRTFLERVIKADPKNTRALTDLGNINLGNRSLKIAADYFDRALTAEPDNGEALVGRAITCRYAHEPKKSEQLLNRAITLYPQWARPLHERARLYKGAGFINDALGDLDAAKRLEPENYWIAVDRGLVLMDMERKPEALEEFTRAAGIDPGFFIAYVYSAGIKDETGDYKGAEQDYIKLAKLNPEYYFAFEGIGILKMKDKKWAEARDAFLEAYKQAPREYSYALLAAVNWMRAGRMADPKQFLAQVLRTAPRDSTEYSMLRLYHDLSGDVDAAVKVENEKNLFKKGRMLFYLACYYDVRGNKTLADKYYLLVQELDITSAVEWRLNEWILEERGIGLRIGK
ncbi:MAG: tetratricopeptide repeat protein [Treponema sp.]|nr:tetratricopeptide repeat protein [Treponema sp.]